MDGIIFVKLVAAFWRVLTQEMAPVKFDTGFMIETGCPKWDSQSVCRKSLAEFAAAAAKKV